MIRVNQFEKNCRFMRRYEYRPRRRWERSNESILVGSVRWILMMAKRKQIRGWRSFRLKLRLRWPR